MGAARRGVSGVVCALLGSDPESPAPVQGVQCTRVEDPQENGMGDIMAEGSHCV